MNFLGTLLKQTQEARGASDRQVARDTGVSPTTIGRIKLGYPVEGATLEKICKWIGVKPSTVLEAHEAEGKLETEQSSSGQLAAQLELILKSHPELYEKFAEIVQGITDGELSPEFLVDAITYAAYRLDLEERNGPRVIGKRTGNTEGDREATG